MGGRNSTRHKSMDLVDLPWYPSDFPVIELCSLKRWRKSASIKWGFDPCINYSTKILRLQPAATGGRFISSRVMTPCELADNWDFESILPTLPPYLTDMMKWRRVLVIEDQGFQPVLVNTPPTVKLGGLMHLDLQDEEFHPILAQVNVIGSRDDCLILQIIRASGANKIVLIQEGEPIYEVVFVFTVETEDDSPYMMEAILSPDYTKIIIKPSWGFANKMKLSPEKNDVCLYDATDNRRQIPDPLFVLSCSDGMDTIVAFDPRYAWSRLVFGNRSLVNCSPYNIITLRDISKDIVIVAESEPGLIQTTQNLTFSPDGQILASLIATVYDKCSFKIHGVLLYETENLEILKEIPCSSSIGHPMPLSLFPLFSMNGHYMAFFSIDTLPIDSSGETLFVEMLRILTLPVRINLRNLCRLTIRRWLPYCGVKNLPLPKLLKDYLLFRPYM